MPKTLTIGVGGRGRRTIAAWGLSAPLRPDRGWARAHIDHDSIDRTRTVANRPRDAN